MIKMMPVVVVTCVLTGRTFFARFDRHLNGSTHTAFEFFNTALLFWNLFSLGVLFNPRSVIPQLHEASASAEARRCN
jgi:hypothetical protein